MLTMDVFNNSAFSATSLTAAVKRSQTIPGLLGSMGLFTPKPVRTRDVWIDQKSQTLQIIQTSQPGDPRNRRGNDKASARAFKVFRLDESRELTAEELQGIRQFGSETELKQLQVEIAMRQQEAIDDMATTKERLYLGCVNGTLVDADDSVIYDWFNEFGFTRPQQIAFNWANRTGVKKFIASNVIRPIVRAVGGVAAPGMRIVALCGDDFFDDLQENAEYRAKYLNNDNASALLESTVFQAIDAWGVTWINYRGTDDNTRVAIPTDDARFFATGVRDLFVEAFAPAPTFDLVNTRGQEFYSRIHRPDDRNEMVDIEVESHRLPICTRPETLLSGRTGT